MLDQLEGRVVLSSLATVPTVGAAQVRETSLPVLTTTTYHRVMRQIDWAFSEYKGGHQVLHSTLNALSSVANYLVTGAPAPEDPNPNENSTDVVIDGRGDGVALEARLRKAVDQLPYGNARVVPQIIQVWGGGGMTPENSSLYRDRFKTMVRHYIAGGLDGRQFSWIGSGSDRPTDRPAKTL
jgi:hypothetical protein